MAQRGVSLLSNAGAGAGSYVTFTGGRSSLVVFGTLPTTLTFEMLGKDGSTAVVIDTITVAGLTTYDLPPGQYRMNAVGGSPSGLYADLVGIIQT